MMGPCAKTVVKCTIIAITGARFVATNACNNPQKVCPRGPKEGYAKCVTICDQPGHAEIQALKLAEGRARKARVYIEGHNWCCQNCQIELFKAGVESITVGPPPLERVVL